MVFKRTNQHGFTIVELMIAISVFAVAMILVTAGVIVIGRQYQQGTNRVKLESATREVHQNVTDAIKFAGEEILPPPADSAGWRSVCVGDQQYIYAATPDPVSQAVYNGLNRGLFVQTKPAGACVTSAPGASAKNLLPEDAVVLKFSVGGNQVSTVFAAADGDLLNLTSPQTPDDVVCRANIAGKEFCAVVKLDSTALRRVNN
jgi:prepilin-type N-terminal cleavage/methylation domain-containing protein